MAGFANKPMLFYTNSSPPGVVSSMPEVGVWIGCLVAYKYGRLYGSWVDLRLTPTVPHLRQCIDWIIAGSPHPNGGDWFIGDCSGMPRELIERRWPDLAEFVERGGMVAVR